MGPYTVSGSFVLPNVDIQSPTFDDTMVAALTGATSGACVTLVGALM